MKEENFGILMKHSAKDDLLIFNDLGINEEALVKFEVRQSLQLDNSPFELKKTP